MLQFFPLLNTFLSQSGKYGIIASVVFSFSFPGSTAPSEDYKLSSMDGEFTMQVSREEREVKIVVEFRDATQLSQVVVEKSDDIKNEFRQCAYIDLKTDLKKGNVAEKRDKYSRIYSDSYYRLRTVTKEGIERAYPAVRLPAKAQ